MEVLTIILAVIMVYLTESIGEPRQNATRSQEEIGELHTQENKDSHPTYKTDPYKVMLYATIAFSFLLSFIICKYEGIYKGAGAYLGAWVGQNMLTIIAGLVIIGIRALKSRENLMRFSALTILVLSIITYFLLLLPIGK